MRILLYNALTTLFQSLSPETISTAGKILGKSMYYCLPARKKIATNALNNQLGYRESQKIAHHSFVHSGKSFLEILVARQFDFRFLHSRVRIDSPENLEFIKKVNRPIVATTGHFGAWELLAGILRLNFQDRNSQIIVREPKDWALNNILQHYRSRHGVEIVSKENATFKVLRCLKKNGISAFLVDQNTARSQAVFMPFLNKYAAINIGPALLAIRSQALIWPAFLSRDSDTCYTFYSFEPLDTKDLTGSKEEKLEQAARFYTQKVEQMVTRFPEQWFWMHKRWKTRPKWEQKGPVIPGQKKD